MVHFGKYPSGYVLKPVLTIVQAGIPCEWTNDSQRLLLEYFDTIYDSPSQLYHSALPLCPSPSWLQRHYSAELSNEVKVAQGLPAKWGTCSRTISLNEYIHSLAYWNNTIAVGLDRGEIIVLNAFTGSHMATFSGHTDSVTCLTFSSNGVLLVSGSNDNSVKLWDVQTGGTIKTFFLGTTKCVHSISISADSTMIASGYLDGTAYIHNIRTEECYCIIKQTGVMSCIVSFSPTNPQLLKTVSHSKIQQWNISGHQVGQEYDGQRVTFSLDGTLFVQCDNRAATVKKYESGETIAKFCLKTFFNQCCFSPDGRLIAVSDYSTIYIWDITSSNSHSIDTFIGHTDAISGLAFSSSSFLISTSFDSSIKFWQIGTSIKDQVELDYNPASNPSAPLTFTLQAKDGITLTSHRDGMVKIWDISTGVCKASFQTPVTLTEDTNKRDVKLVDGRIIFVWYEDEKINVWDVEKREPLFAVALHGLAIGPLSELVISGDGSKVFCWGTKHFKALSLQSGEVVGEVKLEEGQHLMRVLALDGSRVWVDYSPRGCEGWDFGVPRSLPVKLLNIPPSKLHPSGTILWDISLCRVQDTATKNVLFQLAKGYGVPDGVQWNDQYLFVCFKSGKVLILDFSHMILQ